MTSHHYDQAENLRRRYRERRQQEDHESSALPSRKETHSKSSKKMKWKLRFPAARLLLIVFLMMVVLAVLAPMWLDW